MNSYANASHTFALYVDNLSHLVEKKNIGNEFILDDKHLVHRIIHILRLLPGQKCILFDRLLYLEFTVVSIQGKKSIIGSMTTPQAAIHYKPHISFVLPLLKRDANDTALYSLVELGVNEIQLVITDKVHRISGTQELNHMKRIMIAAAEQSKNYAFPLLHEPMPFYQYMEQKAHNSTPFLFADPHGTPLQEHLDIIKQQHAQNIVLMIGPEGDLTKREKNTLWQHTADFCRLTPTILRACQAAAIFAGACRSIL